MEEFKIIKNENEESKYKKQYLRLFNAITDAIECRDIEEAKSLLFFDLIEENEESVYKEMYHVLVESIIEARNMNEKDIFNEVLIQAQQKTEDMYI